MQMGQVKGQERVCFTPPGSPHPGVPVQHQDSWLRSLEEHSNGPRPGILQPLSASDHSQAWPGPTMGLTLSHLHHSRSLPCSSPSAFTTTSIDWDRDMPGALGAAEDAAFPHPAEISSSLSFIASQALGTLLSPVSAPEMGVTRFSGSRDRTWVKFPAGNLQSKRLST